MADQFDPYYTWLGVPPEEQPADYYRLLGVRRYESNTDVINNAADQRMAHIRTFQAGKRSGESQKILNELAAAVVCLADPKKKATYDQQLRAQELASTIPVASTPLQAWQQPPPAGPPMPLPVAVAAPVAVASPAAQSFVSTGAPAVRVSGGRTKNNTPLFLGGLVLAAIVLAGVAVWVTTQGGASKPTVPVAKAEPKKELPPPVKPPDIETSIPNNNPPDSPSETTTEISTVPKTEPVSSSATNSAEDLRQEWRFHTASRGVFKRAKDHWLLARAGKEDELWDEVARTPAHVELKEPKSGRMIRLQEERYSTSTDGRRWVGTSAGTWATGNSPATTGTTGTKPPVGSKLSPEMAALVPAGVKAVSLAGLDLASQRISGKVERNNNDWRLATTPQEKLVKLKLPIKPPPAYLLELEFTVVEPGLGALGIGLMVNGKPCTLQLDAYPSQGYRSGLEVIATQRVVDQVEPIVVRGKLLTKGERNYAAVLVQPGRVLAEVNGKRVTTWAGDADTLSQAPEHAIPDGLLGLTALRSELLLHAVRLTSLPTPDVAMSDPETMTMPPEPGSKPSRLPVPTEEALDAARQRLKGAFGAEVAKAGKPTEKAALARQFLETAKNEASPSVRYAVLQAARKLAIGAADVTLAVSLANEVSGQYDTDALVLQAETLADLSKAELATNEQEKLVDAALKSAHESLENEQVDPADSLSQLAVTMANRAKDPVRRKAAKAMRDEVVRFKDSFEAYQVAAELLEVDPGDAKANLAVGKFYCFERRDWIRGREHLAKTSVENLASAAKLEMEASDSQGVFAAANAWYELRESFAGRERTSIERHAADLYEVAAVDVTGVDKVTLDKRLAELNTALALADKAVADAGGPQITPRKSSLKYVEGLMVRAFVTTQGRDVATPYVCTVQTYAEIPDAEIKQLITDNYGRRSNATYYIVGYVVLDAETELAIRLESCSCKLGNEPTITATNSLQSFTRTLKKGVWPVVLNIKTSSQTASPYFAIKNATNDKNVLFYLEKEWDAESKKGVPLPNGGSVRSQIVSPR